MKERATAALEKVKSVIGALNRKTKILIVGVLVTALALIIGLVAYNSAKSSDYTTLFSDLNTEEATTILGKLDEYGAPYRYKGSGTIEVLTEQEPQLKAKLLQEGYPKSGFTYKVFTDNVSMMSTDFEKEQFKLYELQDRIQATLRCFEGVKDAIVTITPAEDNRYVLNTKELEPAKASVTLTLKEDAVLKGTQVGAIQNLVARAVPGLLTENISIVDTEGNFYSAEDTGDAAQDKATQLKLETERKIEQTTRQKVLDVLEGFYGEDNVRVSVKSVVDVRRTLQEATTYASPEGAPPGAGIPNQIGKNQEVIRPNEEANAVGGVVGTQSNADINTYVNQNNGVVGANDTYASDKTQTNFSLNTIKEQNEIYAPQLMDLTVAVSINSDGYGALSQPQIVELVARAAGIPPENEQTKISVAASPFYNTNPVEEPENAFLEWAQSKVFGIPMWVIAGAVFALFLLIVILVSMLLRRRRKKRALRAAEQQAELDRAAMEAEFARQAELADMQKDLLNIQNEKSMELKENIRKFSEESPEVAADLLSSWLRGGSEE
ncbi:MAG: flagellar M-ring protein FliF [Butyricicoccus pullicaecorum]|nr:flagellar M-ring protein FliF [Butyricicoccus pullicaecorum]